MYQTAYPVVNRGTARIGASEVSLWAGFERVAVEERLAPVDEVTHSSSITRPQCACKILNGKGLGQGCSIPTEGFPGSSVARDGGGPSTLAVVGGVSGVGLILALAAGIL